MRRELLILFYSFLFQFSNTSAQNISVTQHPDNFSFQYLDNTNGLLHNEVNAITQDSRGFIWLGTPKGLQRYDGLRLQHYRDTSVNPGESIIIADLRSDDSCSSIWFRTRDWEIKQFQWMNHKFIRHHKTSSSTLQEDKYTDANGIEWKIVHNPMCETDKLGKTKKGYVTVYRHGKKFEEPAYMLKDLVSNRTWISLRNHGLLLFDGNAKKVYMKGSDSLQDPLLEKFEGNASNMWQMTRDSKGNIWLYGFGALFYRYNDSSRTISKCSLESGSERKDTYINQQNYSVTTVLEDNHGVIWIGTDNAGLLRFNPVSHNFHAIKHQQKNRPGINYTYTINTIYQDKEENIWIGTDKGISIFNPYKHYFSVIRHEENNTNSLPKNLISAVIETKSGEILIGTSGGGITVYDKQWCFKKRVIFKEPDKNKIFSFIEDDEGKIWAGCQGGRIHHIQRTDLQIHSIHPPELKNSTVNTMSKDNKGNIWLGLGNGKIVKWDKEKQAFIQFNEMPQTGLSLSSPVNNIFIDKSQNFWISSFDGFRHFDAISGLYTASYLPDKNNNNSISSKNCFGIEEYNDSILLIGTGNGGLNLFNKNTKQFSQLPIDEEKGIYSAFALKKDTRGNIWFTTDYNIYKLDPATHYLVSCKLEKGLINSFFRPGRFYNTRSGQWLIWTYAEVLGFYPDRIDAPQNNFIPVTITGFKVFDQSISIDKMLKAGKTINLSHRQNFITIEFASLSFLATSEIKYYYQLMGVDDNWIAGGKKQFANYTKLVPGKYSFRVTTSPLSEPGKITSFDFFITPPFWQTWWLKTAVGLLIAFAVYFLIRKRIQAIRHQSKMKQRLAETEMTALRAQMNPHFIFNCLSAIDNLIQTNQPDKATTYLARFAKLLRSILYSSKNNLVPFQRDLETLELYLQMEQFRNNDKFSYSVDVDPELLNTDLYVPPMIVQPFLENAIHHGLLNKQTPDRQLRISIGLKEDHILYSITDNGIGRPNAAMIKKLNRPEHISYGIQIIRDRIQLHNRNRLTEELKIIDLQNNGEASGTAVEMKITITDSN